ncbi:restriction endonuclease [Acinetobacter sp. ANC 4169]|uniref:McrC family protein n=1 Tax=Acinetobacter terrae TaxID=2731247 RepID=A0A8E4FAG3_9GAMM|nr:MULTISPECIES: McrC family protein [Acinetobacter]NNH39432.1 McrC family protein [Acinetobacter terrae]OTG71633.1 restriction endonuclease [Acinetobacter sp. ANC 4169]
MMITVTEYAELQSYNKAAISNTKKAYVSQETLDWLIDNYQDWKPDETDAEPVLTDFKKNSFKLGAYVGYIQSPFNGEQIQIYPKIEIGNGSIAESKAILKKMLEAVYDLNAKELSEADLDHQELPLHEWIITKFLGELEQLLHIGFKRDYELIQDEQSFVKGRLLVDKQMRRGPGQEAIFDLEYDDFLFNGVENRLIKTALNYVLELTRSEQSLLMAYDFSVLLESIPELLNPNDYINKWREDRLLSHYMGIKPWCEIILTHISPSFQHGLHRGISLLFSMPHLFEKYVAKLIEIRPANKLYLQPSQRTLIEHEPKEAKRQHWFKLEPDMAIREGIDFKVIVDTKWKLINQNKKTSQEKYGISQADLYQMFAYGHKYLNASGKIVLIYPMHSNFTVPLPIFHFSDQLSLYVIPCDLLKEKLVHENLIEQII